MIKIAESEDRFLATVFSLTGTIRSTDRQINRKRMKSTILCPCTFARISVRLSVRPLPRTNQKVFFWYQIVILAGFWSRARDSISHSVCRLVGRSVGHTFTFLRF